jgi:hypothetical protein
VEYTKRLFDFDKLNIVLITPIPISIIEGLVLENSFLSIEKEAKHVNYKVGLGGEVLVSENFHGIHFLDLNYLPNSPSVLEIDILKKIKTQFGVLIQNNSAPKYKGIASECRVLEVPSTGIGTEGFSNKKFRILMTDFIEVYLPI